MLLYRVLYNLSWQRKDEVYVRKKRKGHTCGDSMRRVWPSKIYWGTMPACDADMA